MPNALVVGGYASSKAGERSYIAKLDGAANFDRPTLMPRGGDRKAAVVNELARVNRSTMQGVAPALDALKAEGLITSYEVNPLSNTVTYNVPENRAAEAWKAVNVVDGIGAIVRDREVKLIGVEDVKEGQTVLMTFPTEGPAPVTLEDGTKVEWNVDRVNAPKVWAQGYDGTGVTVGVVDTGIDVNHPALKSVYRGTKADGTFDDNYNFFDAVNGKTGAYDDNKHGTHVSGTIAGHATEGHAATGVAPGAKLIGSKILSGSGSGTLQGVMKGLEWMLAPTDSNGQNADPSKAPDIISNSWGTSNGKLASFRDLMKSFLAAGIEPVFAAGNSGPRASSVGAPGSYPEVISVAATDSDDKVASFSSRGPSPIKSDDGSDKKPDISAPGHRITSSLPGGGYGSLSGTSMATPAVSGVVALLLSKYKDLTHDEVVKALQTSARDIDTPGYDYNSGYGLIDAEAALKAADAIVAAIPPGSQDVA
ncbi:MAG: S8 family serine peptidase [Thermoleophilia bacterium]|nr:S8 family serine peptidase [Thermoleophilia bacterium]